jgi:hypothetical protein
VHAPEQSFWQTPLQVVLHVWLQAPEHTSAQDAVQPIQPQVQVVRQLEPQDDAQYAVQDVKQKPEPQHASASFCCDIPGIPSPKNASAAPAAIDPAFFTASLRDNTLLTASVNSFETSFSFDIFFSPF